MYKPLPDSLTIKRSKVNGLGLFAAEGIAQGTNLGVSHLEMAMLDNKQSIYRTPLGGFINHSGEANCVKVELRTSDQDASCVTKKWNLVTIRDIKKDEELTVRYTFYKI